MLLPNNETIVVPQRLVHTTCCDRSTVDMRRQVDQWMRTTRTIDVPTTPSWWTNTRWMLINAGELRGMGTDHTKDKRQQGPYPSQNLDSFSSGVKADQGKGTMVVLTSMRNRDVVRIKDPPHMAGLTRWVHRHHR